MAACETMRRSTSANTIDLTGLPGLLWIKGVKQDVLPLARNDLIGGDAEKTNFGSHKISFAYQKFSEKNVWMFIEKIRSPMAFCQRILTVNPLNPLPESVGSACITSPD